MAGNPRAVERDATQEVSRRTLERVRGTSGASRKTVVVALAANAAIAVTKLAGGLISGSTALLAEAAHSLADTTNQGFLLASIALSEREPREDQPFGFGRHRFLWTFLAAVGMFVAGATFAVGYGIVELIRGGEGGGFGVAWITLAISIVAEGASWVRASRHLRAQAREAGKPPRRYIRESRDPNVKMVLFEDTAALAGIAVAAVGIGLHQAAGQSFWDPAASVVVGVLLIGVAVWMARDSGRLLVGGAATPEERAAIERVLDDHPHVVEVERTATDLDDALRRAVPDVTEVFLDPWPGR
jgi:cation diffusion facilitator family transporter